MSAQELLSFLFSLLGDVFKKSAYFSELKQIVFDNMDDDFETISVSSELFDKLPETETDFKVLVGESMLEFKSGELFLNIVKVDDTYIVELTLDKEDKITSTIATISDFSRIETSCTTFNDDEYVDFNVNVYYYEKDQMAHFTLKGEKVYVFTKMFKLPFQLGAYFYRNIKQFLAMYNGYENGESVSLEELLTSADYYAFMVPFNLSSMDDFFHNYFRLEIDEKLLEVVNEHINLGDFINDASILIKDILEKTGIDGKATMTYSLYQSILLYLLGYTEELNTRGFLIKELDGYYTLYSIVIEDSRVKISETLITSDEALSLYRQNPINFTISELSNFFGIQPSRY